MGPSWTSTTSLSAVWKKANCPKTTAERGSAGQGSSGTSCTAVPAWPGHAAQALQLLVFQELGKDEAGLTDSLGIRELFIYPQSSITAAASSLPCLHLPGAFNTDSSAKRDSSVNHPFACLHNTRCIISSTGNYYLLFVSNLCQAVGSCRVRDCTKPKQTNNPCPEGLNFYIETLWSGGWLLRERMLTV